MIVGDTSVLAIESMITKAYERPSFFALGSFAIHLMKYRYGCLGSEATLLACSLDEVEKRVQNRGLHTADFAYSCSASQIAHSFYAAMYLEPCDWSLCDLVSRDICKEVTSSDLKFQWAPDGDAAFDDGSYILHFDLYENVRVIGFQCDQGGHLISSSLRDINMKANEFYELLERWSCSIRSEWKSLPKVAG